MFDVVSVAEPTVDHNELADRYGFVVSDAPYDILLADAGFTHVGAVDMTARYTEVAHRWLAAARDLEGELRDAMGDEVFDEKLASREASFEMVDSGELGRTRFWATAAKPSSPLMAAPD